MTHAAALRRLVGDTRSRRSLGVITIFIVLWMLFAIYLSSQSDWHAKDWHLVLGDVLFFVFGYRLAFYHERALDKEAHLTTALGDLEMLEKIVVLRIHADRLRFLAAQPRSTAAARKHYESEARGPALSLFGDARAGLALFGFAKPRYQQEFAREIVDALPHAEPALHIDRVWSVADAFAAEATVVSGEDRHGDEMSGASRDQLRKAAQDLRDAASASHVPSTPADGVA
jgi:hypothetical protein